MRCCSAGWEREMNVDGGCWVALKTAFALLTVGALSGCAITPVAAWDKGDLARPAMQFDADRLDTAFGDHVYFSKEAASGGRGVGGGGCGCN